MDEVGKLIKNRFDVADINRTNMVHFTPSDRHRIRDWIDERPAVVRCMECMYAKVAPDDNGYFYCKYPFASKAPHESHFYCANGKREDAGKELEKFLREIVMDEKKERNINNCPNCGAPLNKDGHCDYCG